MAVSDDPYISHIKVDGKCSVPHLRFFLPQTLDINYALIFYLSLVPTEPQEVVLVCYRFHWRPTKQYLLYANNSVICKIDYLELCLCWALWDGYAQITVVGTEMEVR